MTLKSIIPMLVGNQTDADALSVGRRASTFRKSLKTLKIQYFYGVKYIESYCTHTKNIEFLAFLCLRPLRSHGLRLETRIFQPPIIVCLKNKIKKNNFI